MGRPDAELAPLDQSRGVLTVQIYTNTEDYAGGSTRFIHPDCKHDQCRSFNCELCLDPPTVTSDALVFQHDILHQGSELEAGGPKYACRTEVMYVSAVHEAHH